MFPHFSQQATAVPNRCGSAGVTRAPPIDFYTGLDDTEAPLTGRSLQDVLMEGTDAAAEVIAGARCPAAAHSRSASGETNPMIRSLLRASSPEPALHETVLPMAEIDPFAALSEADQGLIEPVLLAAVLPSVGDAVTTSGWLQEPPIASDGLSAEVMRYLQTLQANVASTLTDGIGVASSVPYTDDEAHTRMATSLVDSLLSDSADYGVSIAPVDRSTASTGRTILQANPLLLGMLEASTPTTSDYDAVAWPPTANLSTAATVLPWQATWQHHAQSYATTTQSICDAQASSSSCVVSAGLPFARGQAEAQHAQGDRSSDRVQETTHLLRLLAAVARRDIDLTGNAQINDDAPTQYDARYLLCAAYRAIILNVPCNRAWLPLKRFTDALHLDFSTFTRWTGRYRQDEGPPNAFWDSLAPHAWIDAFDLVDVLETGDAGHGLRLEDLTRSRLRGRLRLGRVKRPRTPRGSGRVPAMPDAPASFGARLCGSEAARAESGGRERSGAFDVGRAIGASAMPSRGRVGAVGSATGDPAWRVEATAGTEAGFDTLLKIARTMRLLAAASTGAIVSERTVDRTEDVLRRYDPRHLLIAAYDGLADNLRIGGNTLPLQTLTKILGLSSRTVYAWRYSYIRNRTRGAAFGRSLVVGTGPDQTDFVMAMRAVMREPEPVAEDLRTTPLHNRLLHRHETTLGTSVPDRQSARIRRWREMGLIPNTASAAAGAAPDTEVTRLPIPMPIPIPPPLQAFRLAPYLESESESESAPERTASSTATTVTRRCTE
jgi:hypothetical protein